MMRHVFVTIFVATLGIGVPTHALAQDTGVVLPSGAAEQQPPATEPEHPAASGEEPAKPTRGFISALGHNLLDDVKHVPRRNSAYWLAGGGALALAVHPADHSINARLASRDNDAF